MDKAINVQEDENGLPRFFLSSRVMQEEFVKCMPNFVMVHTENLAKLPLSLNRLLNEESSDLMTPCMALVDSTYGVHRRIAFHCPQWPENARQWPHRRRKWPGKGVIGQVVEKGVYVVPCKTCSADYQSEEDLERAMDAMKNEWSVCFVDAEKELFAHLNPAQHFCFLLLKDLLLNQPQCQPWLTESHIKYALLWALEETGEQSWTLDRLHDCMRLLIESFRKYFQHGSLRHYFIPEVNVWSGVRDKEVFQDLGQDMKTLSENMADIEEICQSSCASQLLSAWQLDPREMSDQQKEDVQQAISGRLQSKFQALFDEHVKLCYVKLYANMTSSFSVDACITRTKESVQILNKQDIGTEYIAPMREMLTNVLGNLFLVKAMVTRPSPERRFFIQKAEECLLQSHNMDLLAGKVKLANLFYMTSRFTDCIQLLEEVLQQSGHTNSRYTIDARTMFPAQVARSKLWLKWINKNYVLGFLLSRLEKNIVPSILKSNMTMANSQMLGLLVNPICFLDADVFARVLITMSLIKLKRNAEALDYLEALENMCEKEHEDLNEKRNVAYLNIVAHCYLLLDDKARAVHNLSRSVAIISNPRNPARWTLTAIQTERTRAIVKGSLGAAAAVGVVALVVAVVRSKLN